MSDVKPRGGGGTDASAPVEPGGVSLRALFDGLQDQLMSRLKHTRSVVRHPGAKGESTETSWNEMLKASLPKRYKVSKGFVVDSRGGRSHQIDVIVHDRQYSPFLLPDADALHIPAESVYAVFETKQVASKLNIEYAGEKIASVRRLHRTSRPIEHAGGTYPPKPPGRVLGGFLALESEWKPGLGGTFRGHVLALEGESKVDLGCVLAHGAFRREVDSLEVVRADVALVWFFVTLVSELQNLGTVPAVDFREYLKSLEVG